MLACSPPPHLDNPQHLLTTGHCHCPYAQLIHDTMTYFKEAGTGSPLAHMGVLLGHCCYLWACGTVSNIISCHSCYKAKDRCYDYLHFTTLPHLKAPNSNFKRRVFTHYHHLLWPVDFLAMGQHLFQHLCGSCPSS